MDADCATSLRGGADGDIDERTALESLDSEESSLETAPTVDATRQLLFRANKRSAEDISASDPPPRLSPTLAPVAERAAAPLIVRSRRWADDDAVPGGGGGGGRSSPVPESPPLTPGRAEVVASPALTRRPAGEAGPAARVARAAPADASEPRRMSRIDPQYRYRAEPPTKYSMLNRGNTTTNAPEGARATVPRATTADMMGPRARYVKAKTRPPARPSGRRVPSMKAQLRRTVEVSRKLVYGRKTRVKIAVFGKDAVLHGQTLTLDQLMEHDEHRTHILEQAFSHELSFTGVFRSFGTVIPDVAAVLWVSLAVFTAVFTARRYRLARRALTIDDGATAATTIHILGGFLSFLVIFFQNENYDRFKAAYRELLRGIPTDSRYLQLECSGTNFGGISLQSSWGARTDGPRAWETSSI
jgi:hypothetical protein